MHWPSCKLELGFAGKEPAALVGGEPQHVTNYITQIYPTLFRTHPFPEPTRHIYFLKTPIPLNV